MKLSDFSPSTASEKDRKQSLTKHSDLRAIELAISRNRAESDHEIQRKGTEKLRGILNHYFGRLIDIVLQSDGDVLRLAGDALLVSFGGDEEGSHRIPRSPKNSITNLCSDDATDEEESKLVPEIRNQPQVGGKQRVLMLLQRVCSISITQTVIFSYV